ncbi:TRAP transporter substrate-binding protein [Marisediminitalea aggregata]|uniref:TRAP transporter substrate-binding protein n=1 Tax=Marisediminitalea aggregata TaxID=634436 RepID=UPI0020CC51B4|nr:TRAP transporter substrate-binding protein DctP [Marisediminitalea aggregata]
MLIPTFAQAESPRVLRLASWGPPKHYLSQSRNAWIEAVNERAAGRIQIIEYPGGQLYGPKDMHAANAYAGESLAIIQQAMQEKNLQLVYPAFSGGVQVFSAQGSIDGIADIKNLRVLATSPMVTDLLHKLEAAPDTSIPQSEQYMALKRGVADAMLNAIVTGYFQRNHEVAPFVTVTDMSFPTVLMTVNLDVWNSLPEDIQQIMLEEGEKQKAYSLGASAAMEAHFKKVISENGGKVSALPAGTRSLIQQASQQVWQEWAQRNGPQAQRLLELNLPQPATSQE